MTNKKNNDEISLLELFREKEYKKFIVNYLMMKQNFEIEDLKMYIVNKRKDVINIDDDYVIVRSYDLLFLINGKEPINIKSHKLHRCFHKLFKNGDTFLFDPKNKYYSREIMKLL